MKNTFSPLSPPSRWSSPTARKPKNTRTTEAAAREIAAPIPRLVASRQAPVDSLQNLVAVAEQRDETAERDCRSDPVVDPEQPRGFRGGAPSPAHEDRVHFRPTGCADTLATDDAVRLTATIQLEASSPRVAKDSTIFEKYWDTTTLFSPTRRSTCRCPNRW